MPADEVGLRIGAREPSRNLSEAKVLTCLSAQAYVTHENVTVVRQGAILRCLVEGNSIRATCRTIGAAKRTVLNMLKIVGAHCKIYHDRFVTGAEAKRVHCDEIWSFVGAKQKQVNPNERGKGRGDVWTWTAIDEDSKLMIAYRVGNRDPETARAFVDDLCDRLATRVQLTTDGPEMYLTAVEESFG